MSWSFSRLVWLLGLLVIAPPALAQSGQPPGPAVAGVDRPRLQVGIRGLVGVPRGDFADNIGTTGGLSGELLYRLGRSPVSVGAGIGVLFQGRGTQQLPLSLTIPGVFVDVTTSTNMVMTHGRIRVEGGASRVRPYVDGLVGFSYLFTQTSVDLGDRGDPFFDASTTNLSDVAISLGAGAGVLIGLADWSTGRLSLDLGAHGLYGGEAVYLVGGPLGFDAGLEGLELRRSRTDVLLVLAGLSFEF